MAKFTVRFILVAVLAGSFSVRSAAWGPTGHRVVGEIASSYLTGKAKKAVQQILGNESMAMASTWADFIRSDTSFKYLTAWHYIDVEKNLPRTVLPDSLRADTAANAYNRISFLVTKLKNRSLSQNEKQMYLRLLIHIVGDVHQPLHVGRRGDKGGNDIKVLWFNEPSNLHRVWDEDIIDNQKLSYTEYVDAINFTTQQQRNEWQSDPVEKWFSESYTLSEKLHDDIKPNEKLGYTYNFKYLQTVNDQLLKAGVRLAGLLNEIFS